MVMGVLKWRWYDGDYNPVESQLEAKDAYVDDYKER